MIGQRARLLETVEIAPDVRHFLFDVPSLSELAFSPGQFVSFTGILGDRSVTRAYSIASAPDGNRFELCLNQVKEGLLSPWLFTMQPGDDIEMTGPLGYFVPRKPFRDSLLIATGTGVAPFRGYLRAGILEEGSPRVTLLLGARYQTGLLYRGEWEGLVRARPNFRFMPAITRPDNDWAGRQGRVQQHLDEALEGRTDVDVYICGLKAMVDDVRQILKQRGFDRKQIIYEKYD
jgi:NAD(P)H-flavin reductase